MFVPSNRISMFSMPFAPTSIVPAPRISPPPSFPWKERTVIRPSLMKASPVKSVRAWANPGRGMREPWRSTTPSNRGALLGPRSSPR